jgi:16S rRNA (guanine966-N2)-methyltransferase
LRIIAGEHKGRRLAPIRGLSIRPTADRIRESVFSILGADVENAVVLDLFAGTGALGLEALSRGAATAYFIDNDSRALSVVKKSIGMMNLGKRAQTIQWDIARNLDCIRRGGPSRPCRFSGDSGGSGGSGFDLVFIDPPYNRNLIGKTLAHLNQGDILSLDATIILEHSRTELIPDDGSGYPVVDQRTYGRTCISFLRATP